MICLAGVTQPTGPEANAELGLDTSPCNQGLSLLITVIRPQAGLGQTRTEASYLRQHQADFIQESAAGCGVGGGGGVGASARLGRCLAWRVGRLSAHECTILGPELIVGRAAARLGTPPAHPSPPHAGDRVRSALCPRVPGFWGRLAQWLWQGKAEQEGLCDFVTHILKRRKTCLPEPDRQPVQSRWRRLLLRCSPTLRL